MHNSIVFGKDNTQRIVAVEPHDNTTDVFIEQVDGTIDITTVPNKYYILSNEPHGSKWVKLLGDGYYKWARLFKEKNEFYKSRNYYKKYDCFSIYDSKEAFLVKNGYTFFKGMKHTEVSTLSFDLETNGLHRNADSRVLLISTVFRKFGQTTTKLFSYEHYKNDGKMIEDFCTYVRKCNPSILTGYNINCYDLPYMAHVAALYNKVLLLGRDNSKLWFNSYESKLRKDQTQDILYYKPNCYGRSIVDTFFLAIKTDTIAKRWESLALKTIIKAEGLERQNRTFYDASKIRFNFTNPVEWEKIKEYAKDDAWDGLNLLDHLCPPYFYSNQAIPKTYQQITETASGGQINSIMLRAYLQEGESIPKASEVVHFEGALSAGIAGKYSNCIKIDCISLYPSIMRQYQVYDKLKDPKGHFLYLTNYFTEERLKNKELYKQTGDEYYNNLQATQKTLANSLYGFLSTSGLNFNSPNNAAFVTRKGRDLLKFVIKWATNKTYEEWNL